MKLLILRLSALGDVAMTVPVVTSLTRQYPQLEITFLSKPFAEPLFAGMPSNFKFLGINVQDYHGIWGLFRLFLKLRKKKYDAVADLHDVLRTKILRGLFYLTGTQTAHIDKGRKEKKALVRQKNKIMHQLSSSFTRYENVLKQLGYPVKIDFRSIYGNTKGDIALFRSVTGSLDSKCWIGIAPFAAHKGKQLPAKALKTVLDKLSTYSNWRIFLFGGGQEEQQQLENLADQYNNIESIAGKLKLNGELALISHLSVMVSMDSANMHLASLTATPVISIWGATHPFAGFMGWGQNTNNAVQVELSCRPCSIFGNKPCLRKEKDYACLEHSPITIISKIEEVISK